MDVDLLRRDEGLAAALPAAARPRASLPVRTCRLEAGAWDVAIAPRPSVLGLLVLDGFLLRTLTLAGGTSAELLGPGDVLRPWDDPTADGPLPAVAEWVALTPVVLGLLDRAFVSAAAAWPEALVEVGSRLVRRTRCQSALFAISDIPRLELRLIAALWHLADRYGHVEASGVAMPLRLTHEVMGLLVSARRPSVSRSMRRLVAAELVEPRPAGGWWLRGDAAGAIEALGNSGYTAEGTLAGAGSAAAE